MAGFYIQPRTKSYAKNIYFCHLGQTYLGCTERSQWILLQRLEQILLKTASHELGHDTAEVTGQFIVNKMANESVKPKPSPNVEEITIPPDNRRRNIEQTKTSILKVEH